MSVIQRVQPGTLYHAVTLLEQGLSAEDRAAIASGVPLEGMAEWMFGMDIRNLWGLWEQNAPLVEWFVKAYGLGHADDISMIVRDSLFARVRRENYDVLETVERCKTYWSKNGFDPLTGQLRSDRLERTSTPLEFLRTSLKRVRKYLQGGNVESSHILELIGICDQALEQTAGVQTQNDTE